MRACCEKQKPICTTFVRKFRHALVAGMASVVTCPCNPVTKKQEIAVMISLPFFSRRVRKAHGGKNNPAAQPVQTPSAFAREHIFGLPAWPALVRDNFDIAMRVSALAVNEQLGYLS